MVDLELSETEAITTKWFRSWKSLASSSEKINVKFFFPVDLIKMRFKTDLDF